MSEDQSGNEPAAHKKLIELIVIVAVSVGGALLIQQFLLKPYRIPSESMVPTLQVNQRVIAERVSPRFTEPKINDILVFHPPQGASEVLPDDQCGVEPKVDQPCPRATRGQLKDTYIKRVVGLPGDTIAIRQGRVIRNGRPANETFINNSCRDGDTGCNLLNPVKVPPNHYYMMGDNRGASDDSRYWGPLAKEQIVGQAIITYWPLNRLGPL